MRRGEVRWVDLDPVLGSESGKRRPAVIVSNDGANTTASRLGRGVITVVPVTSNTTRVYPFQVLLDADDAVRQAVEAEVVRGRFVRQVVEESMRLYPPAWGFSRQAIEPDVIALQEVRRNLQAQARLADSARSREGEQACI